MWTIYACETVTGKTIGVLDALVQSWGREMNGTDTLQVNLEPGALTPRTRDAILPLIEPERMSLVLDWDGSAIVWGKVENHSWANGALAINCVSVASLMNDRKVHNWAIPYATESITFSNMSLGSIAVNVGQVGTNPSKPGASLPIVWPSTEADTDPTHTRTYFGYELKTVADAWTELTGVVNGPDIDLQPSWVDATKQQVQLLARVGTDEQPMIFSPAIVAFDWASPESGLVDLTVITDGSQMSTTRWGLGNGTDVSTLMSKQDSTALVNDGWPLMEGETDYTSVSVQATLDGNVQGDLATYSTPTEQWGLIVDGSMTPTFGSYLVGDLCSVRVKNHPRIPDGVYLMRMIQFTGNASDQITIAVQQQG